MSAHVLSCACATTAATPALRLRSPRASALSPVTASPAFSAAAAALAPMLTAAAAMPTAAAVATAAAPPLPVQHPTPPPQSVEPPATEGGERAALLAGLAESPKSVPVSFLYDARGSAIYEDITRLASYYPYEEERRLLRASADDIVARCVTEDAVVVELGCGPATKTCILLEAVARQHGGRCEFVGIDVSQSFLDEARENIAAAVPTAQVTTVHADYLDGLREARRLFPSRPLVVLWLGSSVGNLDDSSAVDFFRAAREAGGGGGHMRMLLCADLWKDMDVLFEAYCDKQGVTEAFIKNGLRHALSSLGVVVSDEEEARDWVYEAVVNPEKRRVEMWVRCEREVRLPSVCGEGARIDAGERILMEISRKFTPEDVAALAQQSGFVVQQSWSSKLYGIQLLESFEEAMLESWRDADVFFNAIDDWTAKPIEFRHPFSFYYGHLAAFAVLKMLPDRVGTAYDEMYSRGIDPLLLDPSQCHAHPDTPPEWPSEERVRAYVAATRALVLDAMRRGQVTARSVMLALEHDRMHYETLAYMHAQHVIAQRQEMLKKSFRKQMQQLQQRRQQDAVNTSASNRRGSAFRADGGDGHGQASHVNGSSTVGPTANGRPSYVEVSPQSPDSGSSHRPLQLDCTFNLPSHLIPSLDVHIPGGGVSMGVDASSSAPRFVWDNEGPPLPSMVPVGSFLVSSEAVSVEQFRHFVVELRGYERQELWEPEDWEFLQKHGQSAPTTWLLHPPTASAAAAPSSTSVGAMNGPLFNGNGSAAGSYVNGSHGKVDEEQDVDVEGWDYWVYSHASEGSRQLSCLRPWKEVRRAAVFVSLAEAQAFCRAVGGGVGVMTEPQWDRIAQLDLGGARKELERTAAAAAAAAGAAVANVQGSGRSFESADAVSVAVDNGCSTSRLGALQHSVRRGGWEWTSSPFMPFPGFEPMQDYPEYSTDFFDGLHFVLKGSSPATHPSLLRDSFRNYYQRQYPFVFAKFRVSRAVEDDDAEVGSVPARA